RALRARHHGDVDVRLVDPLADPFVLDRAAALLRHAFLVHLVVVERAVVGDEKEARQLVMRCRPERRVAHEEVAIAHDAHHHALLALEPGRGAARDPGTGAPAPAATAAG